jgi:hypothetical protein
MSHGVHQVQHDAEHKIQHGGGHSEDHNLNKKVALLIAVLALFLSVSEMLGKSAQTAGLNHQIEASNLWSFFQAKSVRRTATEIAADQMRLGLPSVTDTNQKSAMEKQMAEWDAAAARYKSEPDAADGKGEGTTELAHRAAEAEHERDLMFAKYHHYEFASAAFQIGIVLASAMVLTGMGRRSFLAGGLLIAIGVAFMAFGLFAPHTLPLH